MISDYFLILQSVSMQSAIQSTFSFQPWYLSHLELLSNGMCEVVPVPTPPVHLVATKNRRNSSSGKVVDTEELSQPEVVD